MMFCLTEAERIHEGGQTLKTYSSQLNHSSDEQCVPETDSPAQGTRTCSRHNITHKSAHEQYRGLSVAKAICALDIWKQCSRSTSTVKKSNE